jgi:hypothetical protein
MNHRLREARVVIFVEMMFLSSYLHSSKLDSPYIRLEKINKFQSFPNCAGAAADEKQMIAAHFLVFLLAAYQHRIHVALGDTPPSRYRPVPISESMKDAWRSITYDSVNQWTWLDFVRFWFYRCDTKRCSKQPATLVSFTRILERQLPCSFLCRHGD